MALICAGLSYASWHGATSASKVLDPEWRPEGVPYSKKTAAKLESVMVFSRLTLSVSTQRNLAVTWAICAAASLVAYGGAKRAVQRDQALLMLLSPEKAETDSKEGS